MYKYTKYKQHIDTAVQQNALNKIYTRPCAELLHKSLYDVHATRASRSVRSQGANSVQIPVAKFKAKKFVAVAAITTLVHSSLLHGISGVYSQPFFYNDYKIIMYNQ